MKRSLIFFFLIILFSIGCLAQFPSSEDKGTGQEASGKEDREISVTIELPDETGIVAQIEGEKNFKAAVQLVEPLFSCQVNGKKLNLLPDPQKPGRAWARGRVPDEEQYEITLSNRFGSVLLQTYSDKNSLNEISLNVETTTKALIYEQLKLKCGQDFSYTGIVENFDKNSLKPINKSLIKLFKRISFLEGEYSLFDDADVVMAVYDAVALVPCPVITTTTSTIPPSMTTSSSSTTSTSTTSSSTTSTSSTSSTTSDSQKPGAILAINEGAEETYSLQVTLNLSEVKGEGILYMSVDGGETYEPIDQAKSYTLSEEDGTESIIWKDNRDGNRTLTSRKTVKKTVTIYLKDEKGTVSEPISDEINLIIDSGKFSPKASAGSYHNLALKSDGSLVSWGLNQYGNLGIGTTTEQLLPVNIPNFDDVIDIETGGNYFCLALKSDSSLWAWGRNTDGQLGDNSLIQKNAPVSVHGENNVGSFTDVVAIAAHTWHFLALTSDGSVFGCGDLDRFGYVGTRGVAGPPVRFSNLSSIKGIACGLVHSLYLKSDGTVWANGTNSMGMLGDGTGVDNYTSTPVKVINLDNVISITAGYAHSVALKSDGTVWSWGYNYHGQLGIGTTTNQLAPVQVKNLADIIEIEAGDYHNFALQSNGTVWGWGRNTHGHLGDGNTDSSASETVPIVVNNLTDEFKITAGGYHNYAIKPDGTVWSWGRNDKRQLGDNSTTQREVPVQVMDPAGTGFLKLE
ncbi:RCC1 domain-containing protein [Candidatus Riflebacteria bacterium]